MYIHSCEPQDEEWKRDRSGMPAISEIMLFPGNISHPPTAEAGNGEYSSRINYCPWCRADLIAEARALQPKDYKTSERVEHVLFGKGTVVRCTDESIVIHFDSQGEKELMLSFAKGKITRMRPSA